MNRILARLQKQSDEDEMTFDEIKQETLEAIKNMKSMTNEWAVRDTLIKFTNWDFYRGEYMAIIDEKIARDICDQLYNYVQGIREFQAEHLYEVADKVSHYAY